MSAVTFDSLYADLQALQAKTVPKDEYELLKNKLEALSDDYQQVNRKLQETSKEALEALDEMETQLRLVTTLRIVQRGIHFTFEFNLGDRRTRLENWVTSSSIDSQSI